MEAELKELVRHLEAPKRSSPDPSLRSLIDKVCNDLRQTWMESDEWCKSSWSP